ncbi:LysR family transcriptional regulator [Alkalibaculum sporogenes]|nr:LysR family transcriptional regulator [Alkalibaculum sporogenes]
MDIRKLQYFISVAETLSFTKAAKEHYISQTAMSQQIASIESELDVLLFDRSKYKVDITSAGEVFLGEAKEIVAKYEQAVKKTQDVHKGCKGNIHIGYAGPTEVELLREIIEEFEKKYPYVELHIEQNNFKKLSKDLKEGIYDIIFAIAGEINDIGSLEKITLKNEQAVLVVSKKHPKANKKNMNATEIADENFIMLSEECGQLNFERMIESCRQDGYEPKITERVNSLDTLMFMVELNRGVSFLPRSQINNLNNKVSFIDIINTHHSFAVEMSWIRFNKNEYIKKFIEIAKQLYY